MNDMKFSPLVMLKILSMVIFGISIVSCTKPIDELNKFYIDKSYDKYYREDPDLKENKPLYFNEADKVLITPYSSIALDNALIMYNETNLSKYFEVSGEIRHDVTFVCEQGYCIMEHELKHQTYLSFGSKEDCIRFIELCGKLKGK